MTSEIEPRAGDPWARRDDESKAEYLAFCEYCKLPPSLRSPKLIASKFGIAASTAGHYHRKYDWRDRAAAYDLACQHLTPQELSASETLAHQHAVGKALIELGISALALKNPEDLKVRDALQAIKLGTDIERKAVGIDDGFQISISGGAVDRLNAILEDLEVAEVVEEIEEGEDD